MTPLQEAARKALACLELYDHEDLASCEARHELRTALAQQELPQKERPDFMAGYDAGMADAKRMAQQEEQPATSDEWLANCPQEVRDFANKLKAAPQPAQEPVKFLVNGTRFKLSFDTRGRVSSLWNFMDELDGRWVALVAAEDDYHLQSAQPEDGCALNHMCNGHRVHIPTGECCNKCGATSW